MSSAGAILADDMGLGKTLQSITLLWTLLNSGNELLGGKPIAKRVIICCPTSLVSNWDSEIQKWLKARPQVSSVVLDQPNPFNHTLHSIAGACVAQPTSSRVLSLCNMTFGAQGRLQTLPLCESSRDDVIDSITQFLSPRNYAKVSCVFLPAFKATLFACHVPYLLVTGLHNGPCVLQC